MRKAIFCDFTVPVPGWGPAGARGPLVPTSLWPGLHCLHLLFSQPSPPWRSSTSLGLLKFASGANENASTVNARKNKTKLHKRGKAFTHWTHDIIIHTNQSRSPQAKSSPAPFCEYLKRNLCLGFAPWETLSRRCFQVGSASPMREAQRVENREYWQDLHLPEKDHGHTPKQLHHLRCATEVPPHGSRGRERLTRQGGTMEALYPRYELRGRSAFSLHLKVHSPN